MGLVDFFFRIFLLFTFFQERLKKIVDFVKNEDVKTIHGSLIFERLYDHEQKKTVFLFAVFNAPCCF